MAKDVLDLSCVPFNESSAQVGDPDYPERSVKECQTYVRQLKRELGDPPAGARLRLRSNQHDLGAYFSVVCEYDTNDEAAIEYAVKCDTEAPGNWDAEARAALGLITAS